MTKSAILDGDATAIIEGCGNEPIVGFTYCRKEAGSSTNEVITFIGPPAICDRDACVFIKIWDNLGNLVWGSQFEKGKTRLPIGWEKLLSGSKTFETNFRGLFSWELEVFWKDANNRENKSVATGDLILRIFNRGYIPLSAVDGDSSFAWLWRDGGFDFKVTTGLRAYVGKSKKTP